MRGKGRTPKPNIVLADAIYAGLAALTRLAKRRKNKRTVKFYKSIETIWSKVRSELKGHKKTRPRDFSYIQNAEPNLRKQYLKMLWYSTKPYGNNEYKRVYSWTEGTVGPLNALLNYAGARLRELAATRYPFPIPVKFQIRKYIDGRTEVLSEKLVTHSDSNPNIDSTYWKYGYRGNTRHPRILLTHPSLPELDFVDMIRAHVIELCRQCFIYTVPRYHAHRYIRYLIHKLKPFLDWIYTQGEVGRKDFFPEADRELREIVLEIRSLYGTRASTVKSLTANIEDDFDEISVDFVHEKVKDVLDLSHDESVRNKCCDILDKIDEGLITDHEARKLYEHILAMSQKEGNEWHRVLLSDFHHPFSLSSVVFNGDSMVELGSEVAVVAELPVVGSKGKGQIDLTVFIRRQVFGRLNHLNRTEW